MNIRALAGLAVILVTGCAAQRTALPQRCTNAEHGFSVSYPAGWQTNSGEVMPPCSVFDPEQVEIPYASEMPFDIAVVIDVEEVPIATVIESTQWERVLTSERVRVAGRDAHRVEVESTGEGLADRGMRTLRYAVDLGGGRTLIATTHSADSAYDENKTILARMMETLELPGGR